MNDALTVLLPIKDRPQYLKRLLSYLDREKCEFPIVIADGSSNDSSRCVVDESIRRLKLNIRYFQFSPDKDLQSFTKKLISVAEHISSKYIVWACDDDFYNLEVLRRGVQFLQANPDYESYAGEVIDFNVLPRFGRRNRSNGTLWIKESNLFCSGRYLEKVSVRFESATQRLDSLESIFPTEAIHSTRVVQQSFRILSTIPVQSIMSINFVLAVVCLARGKFFIDDNVLLLRQDNTPGSAGVLALARQDRLAEVFERLSLLDEVNRQLRIDVTTLKLALLTQLTVKDSSDSSVLESTTGRRARTLLSHQLSQGFSLYLQLLLAELKGVVSKKKPVLALVDSKLLTDKHVPFFIKVQCAISKR